MASGVYKSHTKFLRIKLLRENKLLYSKVMWKYLSTLTSVFGELPRFGKYFRVFEKGPWSNKLHGAFDCVVSLLLLNVYFSMDCISCISNFLMKSNRQIILISQKKIFYGLPLSEHLCFISQICFREWKTRDRFFRNFLLSR